MENFELYIDTPPKRKHGYFPKNHIPFNKGIPMKDWMDGRKIKKVKKCLELGRIKGNATMAESNRISIIGIKDGKLYPFDSAVNAANILKAKGIKINCRNINAVVHSKKQKNNRNGLYYIRLRAGGFRWFFTSEVEKYKDLVK